LERKVKRRQFILQENYSCKHYTFVVSGCFKMYGVDDNGGEHIIQFAAQNSSVTKTNYERTAFVIRF
jgi:CRP-like cAMP-binding protein